MWKRNSPKTSATLINTKFFNVFLADHG